jgi:hypothetical protein
MIIIKTIIGLIAISIALITLYAIGRVTIRVIDPDTERADAEQVALAALMGVLALAVCAMIVSMMYLLGSVIMGALGY